MDKIADYIKQPDVIMGLFFIVIGIVVGVFKQYWLIAGVNTMSGKKLAKIDLDYLTKYFGLFFGVFGLLMVLSPLLFDYFSVTHGVRYSIVWISVISFVVFILLYFNVIKRNRVYKKN
ncbi:MAG: DUF3784 domain-containing protein [Bacteroidales bacterium]|jgi:MFS family permease|nr:DUF3784 domain-containing protein [Bacteroidales bacterium]